MQHLASDNYAGLCPEALEYFLKANEGHDLAYGEDQWTKKASELFRELFETDCEVFFVFNGTAGNSLALSSLCQSYHGIICHPYAHIETDECGAPEFFSNGSKILLADGPQGKIDPDAIEELILKRNDIHYPKPKVLSITQATETGTVYTIEELKAVTSTAKRYNLKIHMDGARFANAVAALDTMPKKITWQSGVDVMVFGGTKAGLAIGDAVIFFNKELAEEFDFRCKQSGQLASKMRFIAAPWVGMLQNDAWLKHAGHANSCAAWLEKELKEIPEVEFLMPRQVNSNFVKLDLNVSRELARRGWRLYNFIGVGGVRIMCSWDTTNETLKRFINDLKEAIQKCSPAVR